MLILTRRLGESITVGENVIIKVLGVSGKQIRLGVSAPRDIKVHREEIFNKIKEERAQKSPVCAPSNGAVA